MGVDMPCPLGTWAEASGAGARRTRAARAAGLRARSPLCGPRGSAVIGRQRQGELCRGREAGQAAWGGRAGREGRQWERTPGGCSGPQVRWPKSWPLNQGSSLHTRKTAGDASHGIRCWALPLGAVSSEPPPTGNTKRPHAHGLRSQPHIGSIWLPISVTSLPRVRSLSPCQHPLPKFWVQKLIPNE